jgi:hypothetical protein
MRTASRLLFALVLLVSFTSSAHAKTSCAFRRVSGVFETVRAFVAQQIAPGPVKPKPQAVQPAPADGPSVDLADLSQPETVERRLRAAAPAPRPDLQLTIPNGRARLGDFTIGSAETVTGHLLVLTGDANVYGKLLGNLVTMDGNVVMHPGGVVSGDILALHGDVRDEGGEIGGEVRTLSAATQPVLRSDTASALSTLATVGRNMAGVVGVFFTLLALGVGLVMFARPSLEIVSDTASHSFGRSFVTGLVGQILVLPTFGMLVVGLVLSVAGILLLPFAVVAYVLLVILGVVGGYLAVAHAIGETYTRRRMARGSTLASPNSYRYLLAGLIGLFALWVAWSLFGWVPVAGEIVRAAAVLITWLLGTVGFGAALLSRAGARENFAGRLFPPEALTDEYLWATPQFGVPAVPRPETGPGARPSSRREPDR